MPAVSRPAEHIKRGCDERFPTKTALEGVYQCIVGQHFACCITHDTRSYIHLQIGRVHVVVFKSRDLLFDPNFKPKGRDAGKKEGEAKGEAEGETEAKEEAPAAE